MKRLSVGQRFLLLTLLGYVVALASTAAVVWLAARPILVTMSHTALQEKASSAARAVEALLLDHRIEIDYLARNQEVVQHVLGYQVDLAGLRDTLTSGQRGSVPFHQIRLFDYAGRPILSVDPAPGGFFDAEFASTAQAVLKDPEQSVRYAMRPSEDGGDYRFMIAVPVTELGLVEGVMVATLPIPATMVSTASAQDTAALVTGFQLANWEDWYPDHLPGVAAPLGTSDIYIRLQPDSELVASRGTALVRRVLGAACLALIVPFSVMALVGHSAIIGPTRALAASRRQLEIQKAELQNFAKVAQMSSDAYIINDIDANILWVNDAVYNITGYTPEECIGRKPLELVVVPEEAKRIGPRLLKKRAELLPVREEARCRKKSGEEFWIDLRISPLLKEDGTCDRFCAVWTDITVRKQHEIEIRDAHERTEHQAMHDTLTSLPNRRFLDDLMAREFRPEDPPRTLIRIDLDHFKNVNDTMGHAAGDQVLVVVSDILRKGVRAGDIISRVGGDEFVIACAPGCGSEDAERLCDRLLHEIRKDIPFDGKACRIGASFGIASATDGLVGNADLLVSADAALYLAKDQGRNTVTLYTPEVHRDVLGHRVLARQIEEAIVAEEFEPFFQPQFSARDHSFTGMEALARWRHPQDGILAPAAFLPIADKLSLVPEIDRIIFARGLKAVQALNAQGHFVPKVSFNVGAHQLEDRALHDLIRDTDIGATRIAFEVLESVLVEEQSQSFTYNIDSLREAGVLIEVDDFGSGHASIIGLRKLAPDVMKIDQRLVQPLVDSHEARDILRALVGIGRTLNIKVTAEGVETREHADLLRDLGCDTLQGYYFARPLEQAALADLLTRHRALADPSPGLKAGG